MKTMPALFIGHGSPMIAIDDNNITREMSEIGNQIIRDYGQPKAILVISAHWYKNRTLIQKTENPEQIFDMYGFPKALYDVEYKPKGCTELSGAILAMKELGAEVDNTWGIDHGTWSPFVHMFPEAKIPVVQLSVNGVLSPEQCYEIGKHLAPLRKQGYLIVGSGNVVHNLRLVNWDSNHGSPEAIAFNNYITEAVQHREDENVINFYSHKDARYSVPTSDHFLPLLYVLGASDGMKVTTFNNHCELDSMAMTSFLIEE